MGTKKFSTYLFPEPSALYGVASLLDFGARLNSYNESLTDAIADAIALHCDWSAVGQNLYDALKAQIKELKHTVAA